MSMYGKFMINLFILPSIAWQTIYLVKYIEIILIRIPWYPTI